MILGWDRKHENLITNKSRPVHPDFLPVPNKCFSKRERRNEASTNWFEAPPTKKARLDIPATSTTTTPTTPVTRPVFVKGEFVPLVPTAQKRRRENDSSSTAETTVVEQTRPKKKKRSGPKMAWGGTPDDPTPRFIMNNNGTITDTETGYKFSVGKPILTINPGDPGPYEPVAEESLLRAQSCGRETQLREVPKFIANRMQKAT